MKAILIELQPYSPLLGARTTVRVADSPSSNSFGLGGVPWDPAIKQRPRLAMSLCSPTLDGKVQTGSCTFSLNLAEIRNAVNPQLLHWRGGFVTIYTVEDDSYSLRKIEFVGRVTQAGFNGDKTLININAQVSTQFIEKPLLTLEYSGGGGIDGDPAMKGVLRPAGFGSVENIPPVWFDATYNIGQIDGYGNCTAITKLMEGGSDMGPRVADYASYTALKNAIIAGTVPKGRWATCVAEGLVGLGAPPAGVMGANATFGSNRTGQMMRRIVETHAGVATADIDINAFTALDTAVNRAVHYWTKDQRMVRDLLEALAAAANATPIVTMQGTVTVSRGVASTPVATLDRQGQQSPRVINWASAEILAPFWMVKARAARPANVLSLDEVQYEDDIVDRGVWSGSTVYYQGNVVWSSDGARYLYINATPASGAGLSNTAYWQLLTPAPPAKYSDGTSIDALRPQEAGSNKTENRTAAAITGQGPWATTSQSVASIATMRSNLFPWPKGSRDGRTPAQIGWGNAGPAGEFPAGLENGYWAGVQGGHYVLRRSNGGPGTVAVYPYYDVAMTGGEFVGQPCSVSMNGYGSGWAPYFETLNAARNTVLSSTPLTYNPITERWEGTRASCPAGTAWIRVVCHGVFPPLASYQDLAFWNIKLEMTPFCTAFEESSNQPVTNAQWNNGLALNQLKPGEAGANVTESRTASGIAGQGALATRNDVGATRILTGSPDSVIPDADVFDMDWWRGGGGSAPTINGNWMDSGWSISRRGLQIWPGNFDFFSKMFPVEPGATYKVRFRIWANDPSFSGNFGVYIHMPQVAWRSLHNGANDPANRRTSAFDTGEVEVIIRNPTGVYNNANREWQFRFIGNFSGPIASFQISITRVAALNDLVVRQGSETKVTDSDAITNQGTAAAISGQGGLATQNQVSTGTIAPSSVVTPYNQIGGDFTCNGLLQTILEMPGNHNVGDGAGGTAIINFSCSTRSGSDDKQLLVRMLVSVNGGAYFEACRTYIGVRSDSGVGTDFKLPAVLVYALNAADVRVAIQAQCQNYNVTGDEGSIATSVLVRQPSITILGGKR